jgi:hypothetical protein
MTAAPWYARARGGYVSDEQKESIYGRLALAVKRLEQDIDYLKVDLNRIGTNFEVAGRLLKQHDAPITLDKQSADLDVRLVFGVVDRFNQASAELSEKKTALDKLG